MTVKKSAGQVIGGHLTNAEKKALDIEARKSYAEYDRKNANEIDAIFLLYLHERYGWDEEQLRDAYMGIYPAIMALADRYEMTGEGDRVFLATYKLKEIGCDVEAWSKEVERGTS